MFEKGKILREITGACLLAIALSFICGTTLRADGPSAAAESVQTDFFTGIKAVDKDRNDIAALKDVKRGTEVYLVYHYEIPSGGYETGKEYTFSIPKEIHMEDGATFPVNMDGKEVARGTVRYDSTQRLNVVKLIFSDADAVQEGVEGDIWMGGKLSEDEIPNKGKQDIDFGLGLPDGSDKITIDFAIDKQSAEVSIVKQAGSPDLGSLTIPWRITLKVEKASPADLPVTGLVIMDTLPEGLSFDEADPDACRCEEADGTPVTGGSIAKGTDGGITYKFPDGFSARLGGSYTLTLQTSFELGIFGGGKDAVKFTNKAEAAYEFVEMPYTKDEDGNSIENTDAKQITTGTAQADATINGGMLEKAGVLAGGGVREIDWKVTVNKEGFSIDNAKISDTMPAGLTVKGAAGGVAIANAAGDDVTSTFPGAVTVSGQNIAVSLGDIDATYTIHYTTTVADEYYDENKTETFRNHVEFTGGPGPGSSVSVSKDASVKVNNALIAKTGSYSRENHTITWTITLNQYESTLGNPVQVEDAIPEGLTLVKKGSDFVGADDIHITKGSGSGITFQYDEDSRKLTGELTKDISEVVEFQFQTTVDDADIWAVNSYKDRPFKNEAVIKIGGADYAVTSEPEIISEMFAKAAGPYDSATGEIEWQLTCNQNEMPFHNAYIEDVIPDGQEYVAGSLSLKSPSGQAVTESYEASSKTLRIDLPSYVDKRYNMTFRTKITDGDFLAANTTKRFGNTAVLYGDELPAPITCTAEKEVTGSVLLKKGEVKKDSAGVNYLEWAVTVNRNKARLNKPVIVDKLSVDPRLELDPASVRLYEAEVQTDGSVRQGAEVPVTRDNITYDLTDNTFKFHFLQQIDRAYLLVFRTDFGDDAKNKEVVNQVYYEGSEADQETSGTRIRIAGSIAGGSSSIPKGNIAVKKYADDTSTVLKDAVFAVYNDYVTYTMQPTDMNGESSLEQVRTGNYGIKEIAAPEGYVLDSTERAAAISKNSTFTYEAYNTLIKGKLDLTVLDDGSNPKPVEGVKVEIYDEEGKLIAEKVTDSSGKITTDDLKYGDYYYKVVEVPPGYGIPGGTFPFRIDTDGQVIVKEVTIHRHTSDMAAGQRNGTPGAMRPGKDSAKTGDDTETALCVLLLAGALACIALAWRRRGKKV